MFKIEINGKRMVLSVEELLKLQKKVKPIFIV